MSAVSQARALGDAQRVVRVGHAVVRARARHRDRARVEAAAGTPYTAICLPFAGSVGFGPAHSSMPPFGDVDVAVATEDELHAGLRRVAVAARVGGRRRSGGSRAGSWRVSVNRAPSSLAVGYGEPWYHGRLTLYWTTAELIRSPDVQARRQVRRGGRVHHRELDRGDAAVGRRLRQRVRTAGATAEQRRRSSPGPSARSSGSTLVPDCATSRSSPRP